MARHLFGRLVGVCAGIALTGTSLAQNCYHRLVVDVEPNDTIGSGQVIRLGNEVVDPVSRIGVAQGVGVLSNGSDFDTSQINLNAGDRLLAMTVPLGGLPNNFSTPDTIVDILSGAGAVLASSDDGGTDAPGGGSLGSTARLLAPASAIYHIRVRPFSAGSLGNGRYAIVVARVTSQPTGDWVECGNDTLGSADFLNPLLSGPSAGRCDFFAVNDLDFRTMPLSRGDIFYVSTIPSTVDFNEADTVVTLLAPNGTTVLAVDDDDDTGGDNTPTSNRGSTIRFRAPADGVYFTLTEPFDADSSGDAYFYVCGVIPRGAIGFCEGDSDNNGVINFADIVKTLENFLVICP